MPRYTFADGFHEGTIKWFTLRDGRPLDGLDPFPARESAEAAILALESLATFGESDPRGDCDLSEAGREQLSALEKRVYHPHLVAAARRAFDLAHRLGRPDAKTAQEERRAAYAKTPAGRRELKRQAREQGAREIAEQERATRKQREAGEKQRQELEARAERDRQVAELQQLARAMVPLVDVLAVPLEVEPYGGSPAPHRKKPERAAPITCSPSMFERARARRVGQALLVAGGRLVSWTPNDGGLQLIDEQLVEQWDPAEVARKLLAWLSRERGPLLEEADALGLESDRLSATIDAAIETAARIRGEAP